MCLCCGSCGCCGITKLCQTTKNGPMSRLPYVILFIAAGIFSIVMSLYGEESLDLVFYDATLCSSETCEGNGSVYRTSFCLFIFEILHVIIIGVGLISFHWLCFLLKLIIFIVCLALTFTISTDTSNDFFNGYANYFARYVSAFYLILQILILIIMAYETNEMLVTKTNEYSEEHQNSDRDEDEQNTNCSNPFAWIFWILTISLYVICIVFISLFYIWYAPNDECERNIAIISVTLILVILNAVFSCIRQDGSFFVSSVVSVYATFLLFAALQSDTDPTCNVYYTRDTASLWVGYVISFLSIGYSALRADRIDLLTYDQHKERGNNVDESNYDVVDGTTHDDDDNDDNYNDDEEDEKDGGKKKDELSSKQKLSLRKSHTFFHIILTLAACYYAMLFTNWATSDDISTKGHITYWINIGSQWICIFLFWWTLFAPIICSSRFPSDDDDD